MIISSIGIGIGLAVTELTSAASETTAVLQGLAAGTLIYVVMFEVVSLWRGLKGPRTIVYTKYQIPHHVMFEMIPWRLYESSPSYASSFIVALSQSKL